MTQEFKKGDRVRILPNSLEYPGETGVITAVRVRGIIVDGEGVKKSGGIIVDGEGATTDICWVKLDKTGKIHIFPFSKLEKLS